MSASNCRLARTPMHHFALVATLLLPSIAHADLSERPNIVLILTDNQGAWTLGCYGNKDIRTPNIDRMATEGMLFSRCFSSNAVCSPTRATLLTGLMPSQHGVHTYLAAGEPQLGPNAHCTIGEFRTLPRILSENGYVCGLSGKWHLGGNLHPQEGFADWTTLPHVSPTFHDVQIIEEEKLRKEPSYLTDYWTRRGIRFIENNKERPFFLFLSYNGPYGLGKPLLEPSKNRHAEHYADKDLPSFPREPPHPWLFNNKEFVGNVQAMRHYAAEISGIDDGVGQVLDALKRLGLDEKTLVIFTADQGLAGGQSGFWGMGDHTRPLTAYDWTMHVPLIFRRPGRIAAGARSDRIIANYDLFPTLLDYVGLKVKIPAERPLPGRDFAATLEGRTIPWDDVMYFEFETTRAVRTERWKYVERFPAGPNEFYDLRDDPGERKNLLDRADLSDTQRQLQLRMTEFFARHVDKKYDLTRGGISKAPLLSRRAQR